LLAPSVVGRWNELVKVVFANHEPFDPGRARALAMLRLVAAVARQAPVTLLSPDSPERLRAIFADELGLAWPDGLSARRLPAVYKVLGLTLNAVFLRSMRKAVDELRPDVLWLRSDKLAAHVARHGGPPLVYEAHTIGTLYRAERGAGARQVARLRTMEQAIYDSAAGVAALNALVLEDIRREFGYDGPAALIPGGVDPALFQPLWKGGDGRTVVYAGTMQIWKGLQTLIEAMALAPGVRLKLIGGGSPEQEAAIKEAIVRHGVSARVELAGRVPQRALPALLAECACAVHPLPDTLSISERHTSPLKVFEYMSVGVPIVASDVPSLGQCLRDGHNARLFRPGDAGALAGALTQVCGDSALAARLSAQARADAAAYTFDARAGKLIQLFAEARVSAR
jgi:glycosyltransferase involved in cell wall biosynthesis